jgi:hypothetical protein
MKTKTMCSLIGCIVASLVCINEVKGDGTQELGPPSIPIAPGSDILVAGTGLYGDGAQPGDISIEIPPDVSVAQVLLYWVGEYSDLTNDTIMVNGSEITGPKIGGPPYDTYRADITESNFVVAGALNILSVSGLDFSHANLGAAVVVILDDGTSSNIQIMDGMDAAFEPIGEQTVPVVFPFPASTSQQTGTIWLVVSDIEIPRPAAVEVTVDGITTVLADVFLDNEGDFMDIVELEVPIPAGVSNVTVQVLSVDDETDLPPASLAVHVAAWSLPVPHTECGGGGLTPGFWQNKHGLGLINEYGALADLNELCLVDDDGSDADFATLREFRAWIKARTAENMAYQLSGHLAAMYMNVLVGSVNGDALVYIGHYGDMISINNLLDAANEALCQDPETFSGDDNRDYQEMLKNALDKATNNLNWVYPCICHY